MVSIENQVSEEFDLFLLEVRQFYGDAIYQDIKRDLVEIYTQNPDVLASQINKFAVLKRIESNYPLKDIINRQTSHIIG
ncbi:hypothetical protein KA107_02140 [Candidatus Pacearchaeota archaeon]|nr:hypothetical protein [Candidatus Pacearchaeota archaeon]